MSVKKAKFYLNHVRIYKTSTGFKKAYYFMDGYEYYIGIYSPSYRFDEIRADVVEAMRKEFA